MVAVKRIKGCSRSELRKMSMVEERCGSHENLIHLLDWFITSSNSVCLVLPLFRTDLHVATYSQQLSPETKLQVGLQVVTGAAVLHRGGVLHRDIKPSNIFLQLSPLRAVLGDFGSCCTDDADEKGSGYVTEGYRAPELLLAASSGSEKVGYSFEVDVYSLGVTLLEVFLERQLHVFSGITPCSFKLRVVLASWGVGSLDPSRWGAARWRGAAAPAGVRERLGARRAGELWEALLGAAHPSAERRPSSEQVREALKLLLRAPSPGRSTGCP